MCEGYYCFYSGCRDNPFETDRCKSLSEPLFCPMWKVVDDKKRNGDCRVCRKRDYKKKKMNANKVERSDGRDERNQAEPEGQRIVEWRAQSTRAIADSPSGYAGQPEPDNSRRSNRPDSRIITPSPQDDHPRPSQASARSAEFWVEDEDEDEEHARSSPQYRPTLPRSPTQTPFQYSFYDGPSKSERRVEGRKRR